MNLLLDTTYLLPAIGVLVEGIPERAPLELHERGHALFISEISLFELAAKGSKYASEGALPSERISKGLKAIIHEKRINKISLRDADVLSHAIALKAGGILSDFIDALILSSALIYCEALVTEDRHIQAADLNEDFIGMKRALNPKLEIRSMKEALNGA